MSGPEITTGDVLRVVQAYDEIVQGNRPDSYANLRASEVRHG